jgi:acetyl esterase/lipase
MRIHTALILVAALSTCIGTSYGAVPPPRIDPTPFLGDHYPPRRTPFPGGVIGFADVTYQIIPGFRPLNLDVYVPPKSGARAPLVMYIHGGGWATGHARQSGAFDDWPGVLASIAARGYVVASINYRLSAEAPFPAAIRDVKSAIRFLRLHADDYGMDKSRAVVWGGSAGGHLAALAATTCGVNELEPVGATPATTESTALGQESDCLQGAVTWYGIFDFTKLAADVAKPGAAGGAVGRFLDCRDGACPPETVRLASPIRFVNAKTPPFLLVHGVDDKVADPAQSRQFNAAMQSAGAASELVMIPGVDHSFIGRTPEATREASLQALDRTVAFIEATMPIGK